MEELLDAATLLHLLDDDDFEEELDHTKKNSDQDELLDEKTLLQLINRDEQEAPEGKHSTKMADEDSRNAKDTFSEGIAENHDVEETPNEIQEQMLALQEQLNALQAKLKQKAKEVPQHSKVKSEEKQPTTKVAKKAIRLVDVPLPLAEEKKTLRVPGGPKKLLQKKNGKEETKKIESLVHTGLTDSSEDESNRNPFERGLLSAEGRQIKKRIAHSGSYRDKVYARKLTWKNGNPKELSDSPAARVPVPVAKNPVDKSEPDCYGGIRLINPLVSTHEMKNRTEGRKIIKISIIDSYIRGGDIEGDWVTFGVLVNKSNPKQSNKTGKTFSIWTLSDLRIMNKSINLFLFGEVHHTHWKTSIGTVVGILNASILPNREGFRSDGVAISVDHPGKVMMMGGSKDFGHCKARKKDGTACSMVVNVALCAYCEYHVQSEYKKAGSKRMELQSMTGVQPKSLKKQILNKQAVMYGGQLYTCPRPEPVSKKRTKDKLTLESLKLQHKAQEFQQQVKPKKTVDYLSEKENNTINSLATSSEFLSEKLCKPTAGSRNLLKHLVKEEETEQVLKGNIKSITPKELLQMHSRMLQERKPTKTTLHPNKSPELGRGIKPGENISLDFRFVPKKALTAADLARMRALTKLKDKGPIEQVDPNAVKKKTLSPNSQAKILKQMETHEANKSSSFSEGDSPPAKKNRLSNVDINSDRFQQILKRKSSHAHEVDEEEAERQEKYFHTLEKKEAMEQKMDTIKEIKCDVISCVSCKYTAHKAADLCLQEKHPLKRHKAFKRFFKCADCNRRTWAFTRIPSKACKSCGSSNFERTTMMKPKQGPLLENEKLLIRGEEAKFI